MTPISQIPAGILRGRVLLVTGANRGIGEATALAAARLGATTVLLCRDPDAGEGARDRIRSASGNDNVWVVELDLSSLTSVRRAAAAVTERWPEIHVLVNNAGVSLKRRRVSADGFEMTLAVNHLGHFLFTNLLVPALRAGAPARVVNVGSRMERFGRIDFDDLDSTRHYNGILAYCQSKLANTMFTYSLAPRLRDSGVSVNVVSPGLVATDLLRDRLWWVRSLWAQVLRTPEQAGETIIQIAASPALQGITSACFSPSAEPARSSRRSYDPGACERLWRVSVERVGLEHGPLAPEHL
ncbi:MAG TPA: SDR family oxidoreductase [Gemmatimonadaceae bacterium]|nr:SDR family oxidoreductase [Gemmatimonadaceae bacterium]